MHLSIVISFCEKNHVLQSMSHAGYSYNNAPMERFYNTLKNEFFPLHTFTKNKKCGMAPLSCEARQDALVCKRNEGRHQRSMQSPYLQKTAS